MNGMTEIKPNIKIRIKNMFLMHPVAVAVVLVLVVLVMFGGCSTARAESLDPEYVEWFDNHLADRFNQVQLDSIHSVMNICPYYIWIYDEGSDYWLLIFTKYAYTEASGSISIEPWLSSGQYNISLGYNSSPKCGYTPYTLGNKSSTATDRANYGYYYCDSNGNGNYLQLSSVSYSDRSWNRYWYNCTASELNGFASVNMISYTFDWLTYGVHQLEDNSHIYSNAGFARLLLGEYTARSDWYCAPYPEDDYVEDDRLKLSVLTDGTGARYLHANLTDFWFGTPGVVVNEFSDINVSIDADGNSLVYLLTSENSIFRLSQENGYFHIETSLRYFELDDYDRAVITGFSFNQSASAYGQSETFSYHILCNLVLKDTNPEPVIDEVEYDDDAITQKITQIVIDAIREQVNFEEGYYSPQGGGGTALEVPDGFNVKYVMIMGSTPVSTVIQRFLDGRYVYLIGLEQYLSSFGSAIVNEVTGITSTDDAEAYIEDSLKNNEYAAYYDIVVFYWCPDSSLAEVDCMYYYYTESGRLRQANQLLADIYQEANQTAYNTYAIYDYLYTRLNDFEQQSLDKMFQTNNLMRVSNEWVQSIYNKLDGLNDIVDAIDNIMPYNDATVVSLIEGVLIKLNDIVDAIEGLGSQNEDDTVAEAIAYYRSHSTANGYPTDAVFSDNKLSLWMSGKVHLYLQGSSLNDTRQLTLMYAFDAFRGAWDTIRSDGSYFNAIGQFLQSFSGEPMENANGNITFMQHIWTTDFDPTKFNGYKED